MIPSAALPHQISAIQRITNDMMGRALLAFEMGLGKTLVACVVAKHYDGPTLFITPASKLIDWKRELLQWTGEEAQIIAKGKDSIQMKYVIGSYAMIKSHEEALSKSWSMVICDESHTLKEYDSQQTRRITPVLRRSEHVLLLSGTPQLSRPYELYTQLSAIQDGFGSFHDFTKRFCDGHMDHFGWNYRGVSNVEELRGLMEPIMIRQTKDKVLTLPEKKRNVVLIKASDADVALLTMTLKKLYDLQNKASKSKSKHDKHQADAEMMECWRVISRIKIPYVKTWLDMNLGTEKLAIYAHHVNMMDELSTALTEKNVSYLRIDGSTSPSKRQALIDPFKTEGDSTYHVGLFSLMACSAGINLVPAVRRLVFTEMVWTPATMMQAEDRIHRIGATHSAEITYLVIENSFEIDMFNMLISKDRRNANTMDEGATFASVKMIEPDE
jgi:SWI/SNF-related matrix-associated actin-dependent regulator 1 of chromatin subfamily A